METYGPILLIQAVALASELDAAGVLAYWEQIGTFDSLENIVSPVKLTLVTQSEESRTSAERLTDQVVVVPKARLTRKAQITLGVLSAVSQQFYRPGDLIVCLAGPWSRRAVDVIQVVEVKEQASVMDPAAGALGGSLPADVFNGVLNLAVELAQEGREGRPIGTIFVLGDHDKALQFTRQMVLNPFAGYPEEALSVLSEEMKETIREFSSLDGAFLIRGDGVLLAAGRQIQASSTETKLPQGMGARHHAAAGITAVTEAVAMVISESSGTVTVFHEGKIIASLEKALPDLIGKVRS